MKIKVKLFAFVADQLGEEVFINLPQQTTVTMIKQAVANGDQNWESLLADCRLAVNDEFINDEKINLQPQDEVALIPPVSGG